MNGLSAVRALIPGRVNNRANLGANLDGLTRELSASDARHHDVGEEQVNRLLVGNAYLERRGAILGPEDRVTLGLEAKSK